MPNSAGISRCSSPSRRLCWTCRKRTSAWATVSRKSAEPFVDAAGRSRATGASALLDDNRLHLRHFLDGVTRPLVAHAALLEPPVRHQVGAPRRCDVDADE